MLIARLFFYVSGFLVLKNRNLINRDSLKLIQPTSRQKKANSRLQQFVAGLGIMI